MQDSAGSIQPRYRQQGELRRVAQFSGNLLGADLTESVAIARREVCKWLQKRVRSSERIPQLAFEGEPFEIDYPGHHCAAVRLRQDDLDFWSAKFDHPDGSHAGRSWMVEIGVAGAKEHALFGLRLSCFDIGSLPAPMRSTPGVLRQIVDAPGLSDAGVPFLSKSYVVGQNIDFEKFSDLLLSRDRLAPVYVIATENGSESPSDIAINASKLAKSCLGLAHVVILPGEVSYRLTNLLGKDFSVFNGAVRTYLPGFDPDEDSPSRHPLAMADTARGAAPWGEGTFAEFLVDRAYESSARAEGSQKRIPPFAMVKRIVSEQRRKEATDAGVDPELFGLFEEEIESLKAENQELTADVQEYDRLAGVYKDEAESTKREVHWLRQELERVRAQASKAGVADDIEIPETLASLPGWVEQYLVGRLMLHKRAIRMMKSACYEDAELVYRALVVLASQYRDMKMSEEGSRQEEFRKAFETLGLDYGPSISATRAPEQGETYFVEHDGRKCFLENHLKKGSTKDDRYTLRIYFFWDDYRNVVVVGSLPGHLQTRAT